jgi:hypothetical protein
MTGARGKENTMHELWAGNPWRILVLAGETVDSALLHEAIAVRTEDLPAQVLVVSPEEEGARRTAEARLRACVGRLCAEGIDANGQMGDADPLCALVAALRLFDADEIIVATSPGDRTRQLAGDVVSTIRDRVRLPLLHVLVPGNDSPEGVAAHVATAA